MAKILLDYVFPISVITPTPDASTGFLKQACVVAKPKSGQEGNVGQLFECTSMTQVAVRTDNVNAQQLFNAGMSRVFVLLADDLNLEDAMAANVGEFFTVLISDDFDDDDITESQASGSVTITSYANLVSDTPDSISIAGVAFVAQAGAATPGTATFRAATGNNETAASLAAQINAHATTSALVEAEANGALVMMTAKQPGWEGNDIAVSYTDNDTNAGATLAGLSDGKLSGGAGLFLGIFDGVSGVAAEDIEVAQANAAARCAFKTDDTNKAKNMFYAFGSLLSNVASWKNQQFIQMPVNDGIDELGEAESLFDDKISFVLNDTQFGNRLALFAVEGKAIVAPYIVKNLKIDMQSKAVQWISANQPDYTIKEAALLETRIQEDVINSYIGRGLLTAGTISISLVQGNFVANGSINIPEPKALWRVVNEMSQTL